MKPYSIKVELIETGYKLLQPLAIWSRRYKKWIEATEGDFFDGATGAVDVCPPAWLAHDVLCKTGRFADGSPCSNWQASCVLSDLLKSYGFPVRARSWKYATLVFGGGQARKNGLFKVKGV